MPKEIAKKEIAKKDVTAESLAARIEDAGYEVEVDDDGDIALANTGFRTHIEVFPDSSALRFRSMIMLNSNASNSDVEAVVAEMNKRILSPKFVYHRWEDGELAIFAHLVIYYPFGLNIPNLLFTLRRFLEGIAAGRNDFVKDTAFDPNFVGSKPALPAPVQVQ
jgi:hypothetical protein